MKKLLILFAACALTFSCGESNDDFGDMAIPAPRRLGLSPNPNLSPNRNPSLNRNMISTLR